MRQLITVFTGLLGLFVIQSALGHATIWPKESMVGAFEKYTIRIPNEKDSPTIRIEAEFPPEVTVYFFKLTPGWTVEHHKNADDRIVGATWNGGSIGPSEFAEFSLMVINPREVATLAWKVIQVHLDGGRSEWVGERGAENSAPITMVK